jgi:hypothetical protein
MKQSDNKTTKKKATIAPIATQMAMSKALLYVGATIRR